MGLVRDGTQENDEKGNGHENWRPRREPRDWPILLGRAGGVQVGGTSLQPVAGPIIACALSRAGRTELN